MLEGTPVGGVWGLERCRLGGWLGGVSPPIRQDSIHSLVTRRRDGAEPAGEDASAPTAAYRSNLPASVRSSAAVNAGREQRLLLQTNAAAFASVGYSTFDPGNGPSERSSHSVCL